MEPATRFCVDVVLFLGMVIAGAMWYSSSSEVDVLLAQKDKQQSDNRHWKGIANKCQDYIVDEVHAAHMDTLNVASQFMAELDACRAGK
jgi:hypothetical protein